MISFGLTDHASCCILYTMQAMALNIHTPGGQQILYDLVNWRVSGHKPIPPIGNKDYWNSRPKLFHVVTEGAFRGAAQKIAPVAVGKMTEIDFHMLLRIVNGKKEKANRALLRMWRDQNPCDGSKINPPCPFTEEQFGTLVGESTGSEVQIDRLNRYTPAGRRLLMDFVGNDSQLFHPTYKVGNVDQWRHRPEYQQVTRSQFRSAALSIAKDVSHYIPDEVQMTAIFDEAIEEVRYKQKLRSSKKKNRIKK